MSNSEYGSLNLSDDKPVTLESLHEEMQKNKVTLVAMNTVTIIIFAVIIVMMLVAVAYLTPYVGKVLGIIDTAHEVNVFVKEEEVLPKARKALKYVDTVGSVVGRVGEVNTIIDEMAQVRPILGSLKSIDHEGLARTANAIAAFRMPVFGMSGAGSNGLLNEDDIADPGVLVNNTTPTGSTVTTPSESSSGVLPGSPNKGLFSGFFKN